MKGFRPYNKADIFNTLDNITITKNENNQVITSYGGRVINITNVSNRYEIFDIVKYLKDKIESIEKNFTISKYSLGLTRGRQSLTLVSDEVEVGGVKFHKTFYILNSTDKSRRLHFSAGLHSDKFYFIGANNVGLTKLHLKGVTQAAEDASAALNGETFDEQIESLNSLVGHRIQFSKIRQVILGDKQDVPQINHRKFDAFKNSIRYASSDNKITLTSDQRNQLFTESEKLTTIQHDFYIDAFFAFQIYMRLFNKQDAHIIKNETARIMKITQWAVRNNVLESLGI
jgi:hypothetical protein